jgi:GNAT superfamily N-acetyltransferase
MVLIRDYRDRDANAVRGMMQRLAQQRRESSHAMVLRAEYARFFPAYLQSFLENPDSVMKVAESGDQVVGYAIATRSREAPFFKYSRVAKLSDVYVEESHRKQGVAHLLLASLEDWARQTGLQAIEVDVFPEHSEEIRALQGLGFAEYRIKFLRPLEAPAAPGRAPRA